MPYLSVDLPCEAKPHVWLVPIIPSHLFISVCPFSLLSALFMRTWGVDALTACNPPLHYKNRVNLMKFRASANPSFPKLTWVADVHQSGGLVTILHGRAVEVRADFFSSKAYGMVPSRKASSLIASACSELGDRQYGWGSIRYKRLDR